MKHTYPNSCSFRLPPCGRLGAVLLATWGCLLLFSALPARAGVLLWSMYNGANLTTGDVMSRGSLSLLPDQRRLLTSHFQSPADTADNYGTHIRGYLEAPVTGHYIFFIRYDDRGEFWLSADESPANLLLVHGSNACCSNTWDEEKGRAERPVHLVQGRKYYFEFLHVEHGGGDMFGLGWIRPDQVMQRPIPVRHFMPFPVDPDTFSPRETAPVILEGSYHPNGANQNALSGQPQSLTVNSGGRALFEVTAEATQPAHFQWRRNGIPIPGAHLSYWEIPHVLSTHDGDQYDVIIQNHLGAVTSTVATLTVQAGFSLASARTFGNPNGVDLFFTDAVLPTTALVKENYTLTAGGAAVSIQQVRQVEPHRIRLVAPTPEGAAYTVTVSNLKSVRDAGLNGASLTFAPYEGYVTRKIYTGIGGNELAALLQHPKYTNDLPDLVDSTPRFDISKTNFLARRDFGTRLQAWFNAPATGFYQFAARSDDQSMISIQPVAAVTNTIPVLLVPTANQQPLPSAPLLLQAGQRAYIEVLHKEGGGGDYLNVALYPPGTPFTTGGTIESPWTSLGLTRFGARQGEMALLRQPVSQTAYAGGAAFFEAEADGSLPHRYQWYRNDQPIYGATEPVLILSNLKGSDDGEIYVVVSNEFSSVKSQVAALLVEGGEPPVLTIAREGEELVVSWPPESLGFLLETTREIKGPLDTDWELLEESAWVTTMRFPASEGPRFFRMRE